LNAGPAVIPVSSPLCPSLNDFKEAIKKEQIFLSINSLKGYNFSSEFIRVYKGNLTWKTAYDNFFHITKRALLACFSALNGMDANLYSQYILCIALWECKLSIGIATESLSSKMPELNARVESKAAFREVNNKKHKCI
jgi:hypothetical protein